MICWKLSSSSQVTTRLLLFQYKENWLTSTFLYINRLYNKNVFGYRTEQKHPPPPPPDTHSTKISRHADDSRNSSFNNGADDTRFISWTQKHGLFCRVQERTQWRWQKWALHSRPSIEQSTPPSISQTKMNVSLANHRDIDGLWRWKSRCCQLYLQACTPSSLEIPHQLRVTTTTIYCFS